MDLCRISILGVGALLAAVSASAEIVYVDPPDTVVTVTTQYDRLLDLDLDGDSQSDYGLYGFEATGSPGYRYITVFDAENWVDGDGMFARGFREGEMISRETGHWNQGEWLLSNRGEGEWGSGETRYLGFFRRSGPRAVLGWIRLRAVDPPVEGGLSMIVYDYAYQTDYPNGIRAGEGAVAVQPTTWGAVKRLFANP